MRSLDTLEVFITTGVFYPALTINQLNEALLTLQNCDHLHLVHTEERRKTPLHATFTFTSFRNLLSSVQNESSPYLDGI